MDRLRILTHSISPLGQGGACGFEGQMKSEPALPQIITIKQELPTPTQYFVKSEIQDNQRFSFDNQKVKSLMNLVLFNFRIYSIIIYNFRAPYRSPPRHLPRQRKINQTSTIFFLRFLIMFFVFRVLVGSTSRFLPSSSPLQPEYECIVYVRGDTSM